MCFYLELLINIANGSYSILIAIFIYNGMLLLINIPNIEAENAFVYGPNENPYNKTYEEYAQIFWNNWVNLDPINSTSSEFYEPQKCFFMEIDNKIFLQDFYAELPSNRDRSFECTIPQKPIVIPALMEGCSYGDYNDPSDRNDNKLIECAHSHNPYAIVEVIINGEPIKNINDYRKTSDFFLLNVTNPENEYNIELGTWRAIMDAIMVVVDLPVGEHDIRYQVNQKLPEIIAPRDFPLITDVKYHFTVKP